MLRGIFRDLGHHQGPKPYFTLKDLGLRVEGSGSGLWVIWGLRRFGVEDLFSAVSVFALPA